MAHSRYIVCVHAYYAPRRDIELKFEMNLQNLSSYRWQLKNYACAVNRVASSLMLGTGCVFLQTCTTYVRMPFFADKREV